MPYIRTIGLDEAQGVVKKTYDAAGGRTGRVAGIVKLLSLDAPVMQGSMALYVNLMKRPNALSAARRELIATIVSNANDCHY